MLLALATAALVAIGGLLTPIAATAAPTPGTVSAATLEWGVKQSFRSYVVSPIAHGSITNLGGVNGAFRWTGGSGTAAVDGSSAAIAFANGAGVRFQGHAMAGGHALDLEFTQPQVVFTSATTARLLLDVTGREFASMTEIGEVFTLNDVDFGAISLPTPTRSGDTYTWSNAAVALTAAGAEAFGGFYAAGTALDALTLTAPVTAPVQPAVDTATTLAVGPIAPETGDEVTLSATVTPAGAAGTVTFRDGQATLGTVPVAAGAATLKTTALAAGAHSLTASFAPADSDAFRASASAAVSLTVSAEEGTTPTDPQWTPAVEVFLADGVTPVGGAPVYDGDTLVVKGSGFDPQANIGGRGMPIPATLPQGDYVVFGNFGADWRPSAGAASSVRKVSSQLWALTADTVDQIPPVFQETVRKQWVELKADGTFTATLAVAPVEAEVEGGSYGVYTYAAGGMKNAEQELAITVDYRGKRPIEPETPADEPTLDVLTGTNSIVRPGDIVSFVVKGLDEGQKVRFEVHSDPVDAGTAVADSQGVARLGWGVPADFAEGRHEVQAFLVDEGGQSAATPFLVAPLQVSAAVVVPVTPKPTVPTAPVGPTAPAEPVCVARSVTGGTLDWGLKESFRSYVEGPIAKGEFSGGSFSVANGSLNTEAGDRGQIRFSGSLSATGHNGLLDFRLSNPRVVLNGNGTGSLYAHVRSTDTAGNQTTNATVRFATLSFNAKSSGSSFSVNGASARLTADGAAAFAGFYEAGAPLDAVSLSVNLGGTVSCDAATDPTGSGAAALATTGSDTPIFGVALSIVLLLVGGALVVARRRTV
ncbi:HtaA domain-containing protein [Microbacterium sp. H1-D42]|uniref:HtaA domain-containing protein n=1 Tax=Microbacterium sp. H1-D42 TaxID=2925844 RepID=UPI001F53CDCE|nr:HtaA domain-containing protein [Microbacterium sp. H1-D42]UNK70042.1 HtaA domain-containing protein [Microbacterium sp. H1-D42]